MTTPATRPIDPEEASGRYATSALRWRSTVTFGAVGFPWDGYQDGLHCALQGGPDGNVRKVRLNATEASHEASFTTA